MADASIKLSGTYDSIEAYELLEEMRSVASDYLPKTGGEITGDLTVDGGLFATLTGNVTGNVTGTASGNLSLSGGTMTGAINLPNGGGYITGFSSGAYIYGNPTATTNDSMLVLYTNANASGFLLQAGDGTNRKRIIGKADGTLTWNGKSVVVANSYKDTFSSISVSANASVLAGILTKDPIMYSVRVSGSGYPNAIVMVAGDSRNVYVKNTDGSSHTWTIIVDYISNS